MRNDTVRHTLTVVIHRLLLSAAFMLLTPAIWAQDYVTGRIVDNRTGETLPAVHVYYDDARRQGVVADERGRYRIRFRQGRTLVFEIMGYEQVSIITNKVGTRNIRMKEASYDMTELVVERKRTRYSRKNNPAVEMMRRVIAAKQQTDMDRLPFYSYRIYEKQTASINEFMARERPDLLDSLARARTDSLSFAESDTIAQTSENKQPAERKHKTFAFLLDYAERCQATGKTILPLMVEEKVKERIHRAAPSADRTFVLANQSTGINDLLAVGGELNTVLSDVFQDVDIFKDDVRLFQRHFMSPIAASAIGFYRYYIEDTLHTVKPNIIRLTFTPNNPQDFGFSGELQVEDSTWQVVACELNVPSRSGVNFVDDLCITQRYKTLPDGKRVMVENDMVVQMSLLDFLAKLQIQRTTRRSDFSFEPIDNSRFRGLAREVVHADAALRDTAYWQSVRPLPLTQGEMRIDSMISDIERVKGYRIARFFIKAYGENFIELRKNGGPIDLGPVRNLITYNAIEGVRLQVGAQTTAKMSPHWFLQGTLGYGFRDRRWKGRADLTYSFVRKKYRPHEFPIHSLSLTYIDDLLSMSDRKLGENRTDIFSFLNWGRSTNYKLYQQAFKITYNREWDNGLLLTASALKERIRPAGDLQLEPLPSAPTVCPTHFDNTEFTLRLRYQPNNTYVNTKRSRKETNKDAPIYQLSHTFSPSGLWGNRCWSNMTEFELYRRLWLASWGRMDFTLRGAAQWNHVTYLQLSTPDANKSIVMMRRRFCLMEEMEFLSDRNLSLHYKWDLAGKIFNRIPLLRRLKWRETIGLNVLWGKLSHRNRPASTNFTDNPAAINFLPYSYPLDPHIPYVEAYAGIFNIFKFFNVTYVHRFTYTNHPGTSRWGIRAGMEFAF